MKKIIRHMLAITLLLLPATVFAWQWLDLWQTADQQGARLLSAGKAKKASQVFHNNDWQAVSSYRAGDYSQAFQKFSANKTSDDQYNAGNAAAYLEHYQAALGAYDKAIAINPNNTDAITNRDIIKKLMVKKQQEKNNSSATSKKNENQDAKNTKDQSNQDSSPQQNTAANNNAEKNNSEQQPSPNNSKENDKPQNQATNSAPAQNNQPKETSGSEQKQTDNAMNQKPKNQPANSNQQNVTTAASGVQTHDEENKQMLRRLADDPGGLLRQKFLRDYFRRHAAGENSEQGESS
jgi:Ca-activated chloride channel homolog